MSAYGARDARARDELADRDHNSLPGADVTALITVPGLVHSFEITGMPTAGEAYLRDGVPVAEIVLGEPIEGIGGSAARLTVLSLAGLDELYAAVHLARARLEMWSPGSDCRHVEKDSLLPDGAN